MVGKTGEVHEIHDVATEIAPKRIGALSVK
jgi:hypothetical protein